MVLMGGCAALLVAGLVFGLRWRDLPFRSPPTVDDPSAGEVARRYVWYCSLLIGAGIPAGLSVIGGGGRLAMRLLAVTGGDDAQGRITEAEEVVGEITTGGTISFVLFNGIFGGVVSAAVYLVIRRLLPARWAGGLAFGAGLLVVLGTTVDPLRDDNPDFDIVGPGWLAVLVFGAMALAFGVVLSGFMARLSAWLPLLSRERAVLLRYLPIALLAVVGFSVTIALVAVGVIVVLVTRVAPLGHVVRSERAVLVGRVLLGALVLVSLPGAIQSLADIVSR